MRRFVTLLFGLSLVVRPGALYAQGSPNDADASEAVVPASAEQVTDAPQAVRLHIIELTNAERAAQRLSGLSENSALTIAAQSHADWMAASGCFEHVCPGEPEVDNRLSQAGYSWSWWAENIAFGYPTPEQVLGSWMNSPDHRANILNPHLQEIGVGVIQAGQRLYWVQDFGAEG